MDDLDFELEIGGGQWPAYEVAVLSAPVSDQPRRPTRFAFAGLTLDEVRGNLAAHLENVARSRAQATPQGAAVVQDATDQAPVLEFGRRLFEGLLPGDVHRSYEASLREASAARKWLRLKLRVTAPELVQLPWEFLYDSEARDYVCLSPSTLLVRYVPPGPREAPPGPLAVDPPLRILGMVASPADWPTLELAQERARISRVFASLEPSRLVELHWVEGQTAEDLHDAMQRGPWHVFHFAGHGGFDRGERDEGYLVFATEDGRSAKLPATEVAGLLTRDKDLRLVVLNACHGASASERDPLSSTAASLVRSGVPAVLAMQYEISDDAAVEFGAAFYRALTIGRKPVDVAASDARLALRNVARGTVEWATPVLYMRSLDGQLFDLATEKRIEELREQARELLYAPPTDPAAARLLLQEILRLRPQDPWVAERLKQADETIQQMELERQYRIAGGASAAGNWPDAIGALEKVVAIDPHYRDAPSLLKDAQIQQRLPGLYADAREFAGGQQWPAVLGVFERIHRLAPSYPDPDGLEVTARKAIAYRKGQDCLDQGAWSEAVDALAEVQQLDPLYRKTEGLLAKACAELKQQQLAQQYAAAKDLLDAERWDDALTSLETIATIDPDYLDVPVLVEAARRHSQLAALEGQARRSYEAQQWEEVLKLFDQIHALDPAHPDPMALRAWAIGRQDLADRYEEARRQRKLNNFEAVGTNFKQIRAQDTAYPDPEKLEAWAAEQQAKKLRGQVKKGGVSAGSVVFVLYLVISIASNATGHGSDWLGFLRSLGVPIPGYHAPSTLTPSKLPTGFGPLDQPTRAPLNLGPNPFATPVGRR